MHFRIHGWSWGDDLLLDVIAQLQSEDIRDSNALRCVVITDIAGSDGWAPEVSAFVSKLCQVNCTTCIQLLGIRRAFQSHTAAQNETAELRQLTAAKQMVTTSVGKRQRIEQVHNLCRAQTTMLDVTNKRPSEALALLERNMPEDPDERTYWRSAARVAAVMGSCPRSLPSFKSGLKNWIRFIEIIHGRESVANEAFPPSIDNVLAWTHTFRCMQLLSALCKPCPLLCQGASVLS